MTAFLQRYVVENEFLRASRSEAQAECSSLRGRLQQPEAILEKLPAAAADQRPAKFTETSDPGEEVGTHGAGDRQRHKNHVGCPEGVLVCGPMKGEGENQGANKSKAPVTQDEVAIRWPCDRLGVGVGIATAGGWGRGGGTGRGRSNSDNNKRLMSVKNTEGKVRVLHGRIAELAALLAATEDDRDSLASLLILAETKMERMVAEQEELAISIAWEAVVDGLRANCVGAAGVKESRRSKCPPRENDGTGCTPVVPMDAESGSAVHDQGGDAERIVLLGNSEYKSSSSFAEGEVADAARNQSGEGYTARDLENIELRRRVRDLETLLRAAEIDDQEAQREKMANVSNIHASVSCKSEDTTIAQSRSDAAAAIATTDTTPCDGEDATVLLDYRTQGCPGESAATGRADWTPTGTDLTKRSPHCVRAGGTMRRQLAWVLGLPEDRATEHEMLAEVMHLVVERGKARTDTSTLEAQLAKTDEQHTLAYRTRLAATVASEGEKIQTTSYRRWNRHRIAISHERAGEQQNCRGLYCGI